jgi:shikimate dehydrogenase
VLGWPVAHSRSPQIQNAALEAAGLGDQWRYQLLPVPAELFEELVVALPSLAFSGVNVTIPHKAAALELARERGGQISTRAAAIGAANTLVLHSDGRIDADNTDAPGLISELERHIQLAGASAVVLGAGGSARAAVWALLDAGVASVSVWNRTHERAVALCDELGGEPVRAVPGADVLVNCTSVGLASTDALGALPLPASGPAAYRVVADLVYRDGGSPLTLAARAASVPAVDGLELLVAQGALSFTQFTGLSAPVAAMRLAVGLSSDR